MSTSSLFRRTTLLLATSLMLSAAPVLAQKAPAATTAASQPAASAASAPVAAVQPGFPAPPDIAARGYLLIDITAGNQYHWHFYIFIKNSVNIRSFFRNGSFWIYQPSFTFSGSIWIYF